MGSWTRAALNAESGERRLLVLFMALLGQNEPHYYIKDTMVKFSVK